MIGTSRSCIHSDAVGHVGQYRQSILDMTRTYTASQQTEHQLLQWSGEHAATLQLLLPSACCCTSPQEYTAM